MMMLLLLVAERQISGGATLSHVEQRQIVGALDRRAQLEQAILSCSVVQTYESKFKSLRLSA